MEKLTQQQKQLILDRIHALDPYGTIVKLNPNATFSGGSIVHDKASGVVLGEDINRLTDEEYVRTYLVVRLIKELRYPADCLELEKTYTIGRPSPTKAQIDVRVLDKRKNKRKPAPFMLIEAKRPDEFKSYTKLIEDQLFATGNQEYADGLRYVAWYSIEFQGDTFRDKCIVIDFRKYHDYRTWVDEGELGHNLDLPVEYGTVRKQRYVKGETPLRTNMTREELESLRRDFHNVLWGGAKMGDTDVFNNLLKMFMAKIYDEQETKEGEAYRFQIELKDDEPESPEAILAKIDALYQEALMCYFGYTEDTVKTATINKNRFPPNKVAYVVECLEGISLVENTYQDDVLGAFFESIVRTGFKQEKGQFFTHTNIVRFVLLALELDIWAIDLINSNHKPTLPYIIDSACGSGTFLLEGMKLVTQSVLYTHKDRLHKSRKVQDYVDEFFLPNAANKNVHNRWARSFIFGMDDNEDLATATKVNMILHGDGNANILKWDGLAAFDRYPLTRLQVSKTDPNALYKSPVNEQFDCLVSNPPFSLTEEARTLTEYGTRFAYAEQKNSENLFIERWYQLLNEGGRLGVVLPDSVFDTNENLYIRMFLYRFFWIRAVVSLPQVTFQPYTPTKTSLLFAVKKTRQEVEAWERAWRKASGEYSKLRESPVVKHVMHNDRIRNALIDCARKAEVEWYPSSNMLTPSTLTVKTRRQIIAGYPGTPKQKERLTTTLKDLDDLVAEDRLDAASANEVYDAKEKLGRLLRDHVPPKSDELELPQLVEAAYDDILQAADLNYTEDPKGQPYCNAWWVFAEVTAQKPFDYEIFFAEAENVGYKRSTRHPEGIPQPNDLFQTGDDGNIVIDTENPKTILDHLRSKKVFFYHLVGEGHGIAFRRLLSRSAQSYNVRFSPRFLNPLNDPLEEQLRRLPTTLLRDTCIVPLHRGEQPPKPADEDEQETALAIGVTELKNGYIDFEVARHIPFAFYNRCKREAGIRHEDLLIASTGATIGKVDIYDRDAPAIANNHTTIVRLDTSRFNPVFVLAFLRGPLFQYQMERDKSGSAQPEIYADELGAMRLPALPKHKQDEIVTQILAIEPTIASARAKLRQATDIINEILCSAFDFPLAEYQAREREKKFTRRLSDFSASVRLRSSAKFHHPDYELMDTFFARTPRKPVKAYIAVPIRLGVSLTQQVMDDEGEAFYVHPNAVRHEGRIDPDDCHRITQDYYEKNRRRASLRVGDVLINRSGEGTIGKTALFDLDDEPCLFSDFTMRLRFNKAMNPRFANYFFRSIMFQAQVEREKRGMGNMTNIFPSQVEQLPIVDVSRAQQDALAEQIAAELDALQKERENIESKRKDIDALIEAALNDFAAHQI